jgi:hypothetical protein
LDRRLGGLQSRSGRGGEEENSQFSPGIEPYTFRMLPLIGKEIVEVTNKDIVIMKVNRICKNRSERVIIHRNSGNQSAKSTGLDFL